MRVALPPMRVTVVVPTFNEADNITTVVRAVRQVLPDARLLVVDDGSPDGTADIADRLGEELGQIDVVRRTSKDGLGAAYRAGLRHAEPRAADARGHPGRRPAPHPAHRPVRS